MIDRLIETGLVRREVPLGPLTTYKAGGAARLYAEVATQGQLEDLIDSGVIDGESVIVLGRGSNMVVADRGFDGLALRLTGSFGQMSIADRTVSAGAAVPLPRLARSVVDAGRVGLEFFVGVPGSVGGAVRQNAGCFGDETVDVLESAKVVDLRSGSVDVKSGDDLDLAYRSSNVRPWELVTGAVFRIHEGDVSAARERMREITRWRKENQPGGTLNAGSVFKNPPGDSAGAIIDRLGLKGTSVGDVRVSEKHANFFVAGPNATARDIAKLVEMVKDTVLSRTGTMLETEIQFVGFEE